MPTAVLDVLLDRHRGQRSPASCRHLASPTGPFEDLDIVLTPDLPFAIDPSPYRDRDGPVAVLRDRPRRGGPPRDVLAVQRLVDMTRLEAAPPSSCARAPTGSATKPTVRCTAAFTTGTPSRDRACWTMRGRLPAAVLRWQLADAELRGGGGDGPGARGPVGREPGAPTGGVERRDRPHRPGPLQRADR